MSDEFTDELSLSNPKVLEQLKEATGPDSAFRDECVVINEFSNALDFLQKSEHFLSDTDDEYAFKWVTLSVSNALYGFMICALRGADYQSVLKFAKLSAEQMKRLDEFDEADRYWILRDMRADQASDGKAKLISFAEALEAVQDPQRMERLTISKVVSLSSSELSNIGKLRQGLRNRFEHFIPTSWGISRKYFLPLLRDCLVCIQKVLESGNLIVHKEVPEARLLVEKCLSLIDMHEELLENSKS